MLRLMSCRPGSFAALLFAAALAIRILAVVLMRDISAPPSGSESADDVQFHRLGQHVAAGQGFVNIQGRATSFRAPGFPLVLAAIYSTVGEHPAVVYFALCLMGAAACVLTYAIGRELLPERAARWAGLLACVYLGHIYFSTVYFSEALFVVCLGGGVWAIVRFLQGGSPTYLALAGLTFGYGTLTRPFGLLLLPLLMGVLAVDAWRRGKWLDLRLALGATLLGVTFFAVVAPWTYRNYRVHGQLVAVATNGGSTFYGGNNHRVVSEPRQYGHWISTVELPHRDLIDATPNEVAHDKMEWRLGWQWLRENPASIPRLVLFKLGRMWWLPEFDGGRFNYVLRAVTYAPFLLLFWLGMWRCVLDRALRTPPWLVVHAALLATVATVLIFWGCPRFRDANHPLLMLYASLGLAMIFARGQASRGAATHPDSKPSRKREPAIPQ